jgi:large subunit ribosomal protein L17e
VIDLDYNETMCFPLLCETFFSFISSHFYSLPAAKAIGPYRRVHYKNVVNVLAAIKGMPAERAVSYLNNVLEHKEAIPFNQHKKGRGRNSQAKNLSTPGSVAAWPKNATEHTLDVLKNAIANGASKGLENLVVSHAAGSQAPKGRRRTYRAHGRINAYMSQPSHVEIFLTEKAAAVPKAKDEKKAPTLFKRKLAARFRVAANSIKA